MAYTRGGTRIRGTEMGRDAREKIPMMTQRTRSISMEEGEAQD